MENLLREDPTNRRLLGAGRRAGTIRARVRAITKFLSWLAMAHELPHPTSHMHMVEHLQVRHSEPCLRGAIRLTHAACEFLEELTGRHWLKFGVLRTSSHALSSCAHDVVVLTLHDSPFLLFADHILSHLSFRSPALRLLLP